MADPTPDAPPSVALWPRHAPGSPLAARVAALSRQLGLPIVVETAQADATELLLAVTDHRLELHWAEPAEQALAQRRRQSRKPAPPVRGHALVADWATLDVASGAGRSLRQPLAKALGLRGPGQPAPRIIDATAGWGEDAWLMASLGCHVLMVERCPLIAAMLRDAIAVHAITSPQTAARLHLVQADAIELLHQLGQGVSLRAQGHNDLVAGSVWEHWPGVAGGDPDTAAPAVVHLDPMFPGQRTAAERKAMRLLRRLAGDDADADALLSAAMASGASRVTIKRPPHAPALGAKKTDIVQRSKASRYDVHLMSTR